MRPYNKIIKKAENLLRDIRIKSQKNVMSGIPIEVYKNYCLDYAERLSKLKNITKNQKYNGRKKSFSNRWSFKILAHFLKGPNGAGPGARPGGLDPRMGGQSGAPDTLSQPVTPVGSADLPQNVKNVKMRIA